MNLDLPKTWCVKPLREVYAFTKKPRGMTIAKTSSVRFLPMDAIPIGRVHVSAFEERPAAKLTSGTYIEDGDLLVAKITPSFENGKQGIVDWKRPFGFATTEVIPIQEIKGVSDKHFLFHLLLHPEIRSDLAGKMDGTTGRQRLSKEVLGGHMIPVPPLSEQRKIASVLNLVQRAIEQQERLIALTQELKKSLMHKLFTEGLRGERQKQTEIGPVPESWEVKPLGSLLREPIKNGHSAKATSNKDGIRTLTLTAVTRRDFSEANTKITSADSRRVSNLWLVPGDILIERANTPEYVGLAALYEGSEHYAIYPDLMMRIRVQNERVEPYFLAEFLVTSPCRAYFQRNARSTAGNFPKIDQGTVEKVLVPVPTLDEQKDIVAALRSAQQKRDLHAARCVALTSLFRTLLHQLMTAQIRVHDLDLSFLEDNKLAHGQGDA